MSVAISAPAAGAPPVRAALLHKLCCEEGLFALGVAIARVVQLADSDEEGTRDLAYYVLSDAALTQKILRLANTPAYRTAGGTPVTTVSRAISLLGFDSVKTAALAMLLVDTLANSWQAHSVRGELEVALFASLMGRELARLSFYQGAEEAAIGALFKNIGQLLVASREHERFREVRALMVAGRLTETQAALQVLGCSFDTLSASVLREWKMPDLIVRSLSPLAPGVQKAAVNRQEWMRQVAAFSAEAARLLGSSSGFDAAGAEGQALEQRYGAALGFDAARLGGLFVTVRQEMAGLLEGLNLGPGADGDAEDMEDGGGLPQVLQLAALPAGAPAQERHPSGKPMNARDLLLAGVQEAAQMRASGQGRVNELIMAVLETLYRSMGFRFATVCLKDARSGQYRSRLAFGDDHAARQAGFVFPAAAGEGAPDLFRLAMANDADLMIADAGIAKIRALLPAWHRMLLPDARSFIVLPLVVNASQLGLFYADRVVPAPEGVPADEAALIRALKGQVLAALQA